MPEEGIAELSNPYLGRMLDYWPVLQGRTLSASVCSPDKELNTEIVLISHSHSCKEVGQKYIEILRSSIIHDGQNFGLKNVFTKSQGIS